MARRPRLAAQAAAASMRNRIPNLSDNEDEEMTDAPNADASAPLEEPEEEEQPEDDEQNDAEDDATPVESAHPSRQGTPRRRGRGGGRGRGRGRVGRPSRRVIAVASDDEGNDAAAETVETPKRRGGFRGRSRWAKYKSGLGRQPQPPVDDEGNVLNVVDDEVELPEDPEGERKIDRDGVLQGGREYRVRTFTILGRDNRLYMLSTEPARCIGFRDSYLFFQKHKHLYKILLDEDEKRDLIERDVMPNSYKGRSIGVVTARSVFREFGAHIVIGGKKIVDDYDVQGARERGDVEGELAVPEDQLPKPGEPYNRNQYVAWHGASQVYHTNLPNMAEGRAKGPEGKRKRIVITSDNWMYEHSRSSSNFNAALAAARKLNNNGLYDIHTNTMHFPGHMQPTHARWAVASGTTEAKHVLPEVNPIFARNFRMHDLCLETAPDSTLGTPGATPGEDSLLAIPPYILDELPAESLDALHAAQRRETVWQSKWTSEKADGLRAHFLPSIEWYPK